MSTAGGRKQGGRPGHEGTNRALFDASGEDEFVEHRPACCTSCGGSDLETIERPVRHRVTEIPPLAAEVVEHRLHGARCRACGGETNAALPYSVPTGAFGPRLQALTAHLTGVHRVSRREVSAPLSGRPTPALLAVAAPPG